MIRKGFNTKVNKKIDYILSLCELLNLEFDNQIPNNYTIFSSTGKYVFSTYGDTTAALELLKRESMEEVLK